MKIGFWFDYDQTFTFVKVAQQIQKSQQAQISGFLVNDRYEDALTDLNFVDRQRIRSLYGRLSELERNGNRADNHSFELADYQLFFCRAAFADRHLQRYPFDLVERRLKVLWEEFNDYIDVEGPDLFVFNCVASMYSYLLYLALKTRGVRVVIPAHSGIGNLYFAADGVNFHCKEIWDTRQGFLQNPDGLDTSVLAEVGQILNRIESGGAAYDNTAVAVERVFSKFPGPKQGLKYLRSYYKYDQNDVTVFSPRKRLAKQILRVLRVKFPFRGLTESEVTEKKFVLFPLHYEPEVATLSITQVSQESILDLLARQLPVHWRLVVKEHPAMVGVRPRSWYRSLQSRYPNVRIVDASVNNVALIEKAQVVATINGTSAIEAMALQKPFVYFSEARLGTDCGGVLVTDLFQIGEAIQLAISNPPTLNHAVSHIAAVLHVCSRFRLSEPLLSPETLESENINALSEFCLKVGAAGVEPS